MRKSRVQAAKAALHDSSQLSGQRVSHARSALKNYLRQLDQPHQPSDAVFQELLKAPFAEPPSRSPRP